MEGPPKYRRKIVAIGVAYFIAAAAAISLTRFGGGLAFIWIANAILAARLTLSARRNWPPIVATCLVASAVATTLWGLGPVAALPLAVLNMIEAAIVAIVLNRAVGRVPALASLGWLFAFVAASIVAAGLTGGPAAMVSHYVMGTPFARNLMAWTIGHALGTIAFMPIAMMVIRGEALRIVREMTRRDQVRAAAHLGLVVTVATIVFAQSTMPLLFLPIMPIVLATFRSGKLVAALGIVLLALIGGAFTIAGVGPIAYRSSEIGLNLLLLQGYIAASMLTVLPATAELERRSELFRRLRDSEARYRLLMDHTTDIVLSMDLAGRMTFVSPSIRHLGYPDPATLLGQSVLTLVHPDEHQRLRENMGDLRQGSRSASVTEYRALSRDGETRWLEANSRTLLDDRGAPVGLVSFVRDVTRRKRAEERLALAAMTDPLTGLANRRAFADALDEAIAERGHGCVALLDLDHFKRVNDTWGHEAGDRVLRAFASIARASVREGDLVTRLGGEEFAILLSDASTDQAQLICDRLRLAVADTPVLIDGRPVQVTVSGGVVAFGRDDTRDAILRAADAALYSSKRSGRDRMTLAA